MSSAPEDLTACLRAQPALRIAVCRRSHASALLGGKGTTARQKAASQYEENRLRMFSSISAALGKKLIRLHVIQSIALMAHHHEDCAVRTIAALEHNGMLSNQAFGKQSGPDIESHCYREM